MNSFQLCFCLSDTMITSYLVDCLTYLLNHIKWSFCFVKHDDFCFEPKINQWKHWFQSTGITSIVGIVGIVGIDSVKVSSMRMCTLSLEFRLVVQCQWEQVIYNRYIKLMYCCRCRWYKQLGSICFFVAWIFFFCCAAIFLSSFFWRFHLRLFLRRAIENWMS